MSIRKRKTALFLIFSNLYSHLVLNEYMQYIILQTQYNQKNSALLYCETIELLTRKRSIAEFVTA